MKNFETKSMFNKKIQKIDIIFEFSLTFVIQTHFSTYLHQAYVNYDYNYCTILIFINIKKNKQKIKLSSLTNKNTT
jgi:hypothetical protein